MKINIAVEKGNLKKLIKEIKFIKENEVYVGIPQDKSVRKKQDGITNAELLFIHTNGSPINNIPSRPVIEPAIKNDRERISKMMKKSARFAFEGNFGEAIRQLKLVGMRGQNVSKAWFTNPDNGWPENSPLTKERKMKGKPEGYEPHPLIDTGQLRNSISYFVKTKAGREK